MDKKAQTHFGEVQVARPGPGNTRSGYSPLEYKLTYINNLQTSVIVELRSGIKVSIPPEPCMQNNTFIIRMELLIRPKVKFDIERLLSSVGEHSSNELKAMREAFQIQIKETYHGGVTLLIDYSVSIQTLRNYGGSIYYHEVDNIISILPYDDTLPHPYGTVGLREQVIARNVNDSNDGIFNYSIEMIDNKSLYGPRFINIGNKVYRVNTKKDHSKRDGIYIVSNKPMESNLAINESIMNFYCFDETDDLIGLYKTHEEALTFGDKVSGRKEEILKMEHNLSIQRSKFQEEKQKLDADSSRRDKEIKNLEILRDAQAAELLKVRESREHDLAMERLKVKDIYDDRSYARKDSSETIKVIPAIVIGIASVILAIKSFM